MKKYIFPVLMLLLVIGMVMGITHFTQKPEPEPPFLDGWDYVTRDKYGNFYYTSLPTITFDGGTDIDFRFHALYRKLYSQVGREELRALFTNQPDEIINAVAYELETIRFREKLDGKYIEGAERHFYRADDSEMTELTMNVSVEEDKPLPRSSVGENLYDFAYNRLKK
ncbi:MAG: hypothetical protein IJ668_11070 [Selenomonadaceae bacterium]|nr:hypothetical protein [Selenomonadaceae bacterium]MBR1581011.1 hypothetical protein [Selenomonadaceae bacterium]